MAILIDENTRHNIQEMTGRERSFHARQMMEYGTKVVAGGHPGRGGQTFEGPNGMSAPVYDTMDRAVEDTDANTSVIYVPPAFAADAIMEAADAGIELIVAITEGIPVLEMTKVYRRSEERRVGKE